MIIRLTMHGFYQFRDPQVILLTYKFVYVVYNEAVK